MNKFNKKWAQVACWKLKKYSSKQSNGEVPYSSTESLTTVMMSFLPQTPQLIQQLPRWHSGRESTCQCRRCRRCGFDPWVEKIPWSRKWQPTAASLPGKFHGQRSLADYSSWGHKESNMTKHTHNHNLNPSMLFFFFGRNWQADSKIQKNSENNVDKEEQSWRVNPTGFQDFY